ncbi:hypothetical protein ACHAWC_007135 [Mediolabrus comicus]
MGFVHHADSSASSKIMVVAATPLLLAFAICLFIVLITHVKKTRQMATHQAVCASVSMQLDLWSLLSKK